ncbi:hypothetical protein [Photobacterium phosphoreum]|uniref:hypothetical protein n=1 Tax=Photobacterium phosphoreum TaxID=659 RepID=UPI0019600FD6|nr:hypothetical protein [Photobacterium phosphoreum]
MSKQCRLCHSTEELMESHIIPRAIFRGLKRQSGQLAKASMNEDESLEIGNSDPKEYLLCHDCEQFVSTNYEQYGVRLFKNPRGVVKTDDYIEFPNFKYETYYLYLLSVLWRASVSSLPEFTEVDLPGELNDIVRDCIRNKTVKINEKLSIDNFFRISVFRLVDSSGRYEDKVIKGLLSTFISTKNNKNETVFYFINDGFLVQYVFTVGDSEEHVQNSSNYGQLTNNSSVRFFKEDIANFPDLVELVESLIIKAKRKKIKHLKSI